MKLNAVKFYTAAFVLVIFLQLYTFSFKFNILFQIFILGLFILIDKQKLSLYFIKAITPVILIFILGFLGTLFHKYHSYNIIKDIFHFIKPILGLLIGYLFYKKINNFKLFVQTIVLSGFVSALIHFFIILTISNIETVADIRQFGTDNFVELIALLFISFYKKFQKENLFQKSIVHNLIFLVLLVSSILYFSRTMMVMALITVLSVYGYTKITRKTLKIILGLVISIVAFYSILFSINIQRNKSGVSSFFYKIKNAPEEIFKTKIDREDHADLWDHWRGYEAKRALFLLRQNPSGIIYGLGYGSLVNLKFYAPLSGDPKGMKYISELHNGYVYILYKTGLIGIFFYLSFLFVLYAKNSKYKSFAKVFLSGFGLTLLLSTLVTVGINNSNDTIIFIIGALLFFDEKENRKLPTYDKKAIPETTF